jgi:hypothetical protein
MINIYHHLYIIQISTSPTHVDLLKVLVRTIRGEEKEEGGGRRRRRSFFW